MDRKTFLKTLSIIPFVFAMSNLHDLSALADSFATSETMPLLFVGHGNPMNAIEENQFVTGFRNVAKTLPKPNAILCVSAHWFTNGTKVTAMKMPRTIYDFYGFPRELYAVEYPAPGSPELAGETKKLLLPTEVELDEKWGLDHGTWTVLKHFYPKADVPIIQLSIDYTKPAQYHFNLARQLAELRRKGILIVGSGNIIHNLRLVDFPNIDKDNYGYDWAIEAREKINGWLLNHDYQPVIDYDKQGKEINLAVPTPEHFLPLMYILGLQEKSESIELFNDKLIAGSLSMTSLKIS